MEHSFKECACVDSFNLHSSPTGGLYCPYFIDEENKGMQMSKNYSDPYNEHRVQPE